MSMKVITTTLFAVVALFTMGNSGGCKRPANARSEGEKTQETVMQKARSKVPVPDVNNFRTREAVAKWMRRMDTPSKIFYVYQYGMNGNIIHYWTAKTRPISVCSYLTPTEKVIYSGHQRGVAVGGAPALDGVYSNGGGGCGQVFFFTADTDAMVMLDGGNLLTVDQPLRIKAQPLRIEGDKDYKTK